MQPAVTETGCNRLHGDLYSVFQWRFFGGSIADL